MEEEEEKDHFLAAQTALFSYTPKHKPLLKTPNSSNSSLGAESFPWHNTDSTYTDLSNTLQF